MGGRRTLTDDHEITTSCIRWRSMSRHVSHAISWPIGSKCTRSAAAEMPTTDHVAVSGPLQTPEKIERGRGGLGVGGCLLGVASHTRRAAARAHARMSSPCSPSAHPGVAGWVAGGLRTMMGDSGSKKNMQDPTGHENKTEAIAQVPLPMMCMRLADSSDFACWLSGNRCGRQAR